MATHDYILANASGAAFRTDLNNALAAIVSNNSNSSEPATKYAYQWWVDTSANIVKIRNSANNAWINLFTTAGGVDVDAASNFNDDVTFVGAISGRNMVWDKSDNALEFGEYAQIKLADQASIRLGTDEDLNINHSGAFGSITNTTGALVIKSGSNIDLRNSNDEIMVRGTGGAGVDLRHGGATKLTTVSGGAEISGSLVIGSVTLSGGGLALADNDSVVFGSGDDFKIQNDGNDILMDLVAGGVGNINMRLLNGAAGFFVKTVSSTMLNQTLRKADSGADGVDYFQCRNTANGLKLQIQGTGDVKNANNSYGQVSDSKLKENIVDANSQWNDIKGIKVRNWNYKESTGLPTHKQIGVVAQELETVSAGLVEEQIDRDPDTGADLGTTTKGVKYSVLYMKAIKCLQEAIAKIETLETKVAALESA